MKKFALITAAIAAAACCGGCGGVPAADRPYVRADNVVVPYRFTGGVFGSLTLSCALYGYNCGGDVFDGIMAAAETLMTELDREITTQRLPERDEQGNVLRDGDGNVVYLPDSRQSAVWQFNHNVTDGNGDEIAIEGATWRRYRLGPHGYDMLSRAAGLHALTDGYFDPTVYPALQRWGLETGAWNNALAHPALPAPDQVRETMRHVGVDLIRVGADERGYYIAKQDPEVRIDLGAQAKGYAADRLNELIRARDEIISATVDIAGNLYFVGERGFPDVVEYRGAFYLRGYVDYVAAVTDPYAYHPLLDGPMQAAIIGLRCKNISVVTSGDYVRRFYWFGTEKEIDGQTQTVGAYSPFPPVPDAAGELPDFAYFCHIIDPHTGFPCNLNPGTYSAGLTVPYSNKAHPSGADVRAQYADQLTSATVFARSSELADVYATALMLMGRTRAIAWMERHDVDALLLGRDGYYAMRGDYEAAGNDGFSWSFWTEQQPEANRLLAHSPEYGIKTAKAA